MFRILYHYLVVEDDIPRIALLWKKKIKRAIEERLSVKPDVLYGKPLRRSFKGYRKLRVGDYRIIYRIEPDTVIIFVIRHRSVVYEIAEKRI